MHDIVHDAASLKIIDAHTGMALSLLFSSSGGQVVLVSDSADGLVRWDPATGQALIHYPDDLLGPINELAAADLPDGRLVLAAAREDGFVSWDARTGEPLGEPDDPNTIWGVAAGTLPDGRALFLGAGNDHLVYRWDAATGKRFGTPLAGHRSSVKAVATFTLPNSTLCIASGGDDYTVRLWDAASGAQIAHPLTGRDWWFTEVATLRLDGGRTMVVGGQRSYVDDLRLLHRWDAITGEPIGAPIATGVDEGGLCTAWIHGRPRLLSCNEAGKIIRQWDAITGEPCEEPLLSGYCVAGTSLPDGTTMIATGARDGSLTIHRLSPTAAHGR